MRVLFVHQNFPGQFAHLAPALAARGDEVAVLTMSNASPSGMRVLRHRPERSNTPGLPIPLQEFESKYLRADSAMRAAHRLMQDGFQPDLIVAHPGWGESLFLKDVWPDAKMLCYWEFFYRARGADVGFDPEFSVDDLAARAKLRLKNAAQLVALEAADWGIAPTNWQKRQYPQWAQQRISVIHDGIDTERVAPRAGAEVRLQKADKRLRAGEEVITFVNRNLEPYRGYHIFMRALPEILARRPAARVLIVGGNEVSYGAAPPKGQSWKAIFQREVADRLDLSRVHFLGRVPYATYLQMLQVSAVHVYLTYPFVLSWSLLEAMSAGCLIVGSRTPPVEEVVRHGENGLLVDFFDVEAWAATVAEALQHPTRYAPLRQAARETVRANYDLRRICLPRQVQLLDALAAGEQPSV